MSVITTTAVRCDQSGCTASLLLVMDMNRAIRWANEEADWVVLDTEAAIAATEHGASTPLDLCPTHKPQEAGK